MMRIIKKAAMTAGAIGVMGAMTVTPMFAQTVVTSPGIDGVAPVTGASGLNPISQWIVLSSLFSPGYLYGGQTAGTVVVNPGTDNQTTTSPTPTTTPTMTPTPTPSSE